MTWTLKFLLSCGVVVALTSSIPAADLTLKTEDKPPPMELSAEMKGALQPKSLSLLNGDKPAFEFWFRSSLPLAAAPESPAKSLDSLKQTAVLGAVRITGDARDYRDDELAAGVYTIRFGLQPSDGNHLGTADFAYFAVLIPSKYDPKLDGIPDYKAMVKASSRDTSTGHPLILSLRPVSSPPDTLPALSEPAPAHKAVRVRLPGKAGEAKADLVFDLVFEGKKKE